MEIWGGVECTVNRVGDRYLDQVRRTGHDDRLDDLERFAELGITAIRYPILWERSAGGDPDASFAWSDARLARLREIGVRPIAGLLHHGSGPVHTELSDPRFPSLLAEYAAAVARRYPWILEWTPINEPLTTARFSGLYGHWYPHARSDAAFVRMTLNQARAIAESMQAIREVIPQARLLHTDDAGTVYATEPLAAQAAFENERRDLALDLLFGRVDECHPLYGYLVEHGAAAAELEWFRAHPCPPDTIGANYYVTSDRLLDHRLELYPQDSHGGNSALRYADIAAVRSNPPLWVGFASVLKRYWEKYERPVALTEVHMACTREEQLRWITEAWTGSLEAARSGVPVRAMCVWSLLGAYDWSCLVTRDSGEYEPGVFDTRLGRPRPTALFAAVRSLATTGQLRHHVLSRPGWWRGAGAQRASHGRPQRHKRLLLLGPTGTLGSALVRRCQERNLDFLALARTDVDITRPSDVSRAIGACQPWAVINATGFVDVDRAEVECDHCMAVNTTGARLVAEACARVGSGLVTISSDLVFDGALRTPYLESHRVAPLSTYGRSKAELEHVVLETLPGALIIRTSAFIDAHDPRTFTSWVMSAAARGERIRTSSDVVSPTYVPALADALLDLLIDGEHGVWHLANNGALSWTQLAQRVLSETGCDASLVEEVDSSLLGRLAPRPSYSVLGSERGSLMPTLDASLDRLLRERATLAHAGL
ncbi:MAG TPA: family 1 glycosylhydrolase [Gemmatimonadaceae bacterium]